MNIGKSLILIGLGLVLMGVILILLPKIPGGESLGKLPGDIHIENKDFSFHFPLATCLLLSAVASLIIFLVRRFF